MRIGLLAVGGWLVAAVLTVGVSWSAISVVREAVAPGPQVAAALPTPDETASGRPTSAPSTSPAPQPSATRTAPQPSATGTAPRPSTTRTAPSAAPEVRSATGPGGTATFRCVGGRASVVNALPRDGYEVRPDDDGAEVEFRSSSGRTEMTATCVGGTPRITVENRSEGGGSGRGGGDDD